MNSKIKELAEQAGFDFWTNEAWKPEDATIDWSSNYDEAFKKFAELIQKECSAIARSYCAYRSDAEPYERGGYKACNSIANEIDRLYQEKL